MRKRSLKSAQFFLLACCLHAGVKECSSQDIHFSQLNEAPLLRNPALAGIFTGNLRVQALYRDQWNSVTTAYHTAAVSAEYKWPIGKGNDFFTTSVQLLNDRAGEVSWVTNQISPVINYHKSLSNEKNRYLSVGFMGGWVQRHFDRTKMTTNSMYDGLGDGETFLQPQTTYWDASVGMTYNSQLGNSDANNFYLGAAYYHITKPKVSLYNDPSVTLAPRYALQGGMRFGVTPTSYLTIQADASLQGLYRELMIGSLYSFKIGPEEDKPLYILHGGAYVRFQDAIVPVIKVEKAPVAFSLSYDVNISPLRTSSYGRGGFEMAVSFVGFTNQNNAAINAVLCPRF